MRAAITEARVFLPPYHSWLTLGGPLIVHPVNGIQSPVSTNGYPQPPLIAPPPGATHIQWHFGPNVGEGNPANYRAAIFYNASGSVLATITNIGATPGPIPVGTARMKLVTAAGTDVGTWVRHGSWLEWTFPT